MQLRLQFFVFTLVITLFLTLTSYSNLDFNDDNTYNKYNSLIWNSQNRDKKNSKIDGGKWFEWWYAKFVDPKTNEAMFFVYGVVNPWDKNQEISASRSFITFGSYKDSKVIVQDFPVQKFSASYEKPEVIIDGNIFRDNEIIGRIQSPNESEISWNLKLKLDWSFNAMGWPMFVKNIINIYWYPAQASSQMSGWVKIGDRLVQFENAKAYQDRNWGRSFPKWWAWIVANDFEDSPGTALVAGGGLPKILNVTDDFKGMQIGFLHNKKEYKFQLQASIKNKQNIKFGTWELESENLTGDKIIVSATAPKEKFLILPFKTPDNEMFYDFEALQGTVRVKLLKRNPKIPFKWNLITDVTSHSAGIEYGSSEKLF